MVTLNDYLYSGNTVINNYIQTGTSSVMITGTGNLITKAGNTSSASIPILFDEMKKQGLIGQGKKKIVMSSFGAGLLWGAVQTEI